jgi:co-chaperonin GroES (HSP10)
MRFEPFNRHIVLKPIETETKEEKSTILVPDNYVQNKTPYETYKVIEVSRDCEKMSDIHIGRHVVVNNGMVEEIKVREATYYLLLENYVYGVFY